MPRPSESASGIDEVEYLLDLARPDLFRSNAFRITGLPADATARQVMRQFDQLKILKKIGTRAQKQSGAFALDPAPDLETIRHAIQRLREPGHRLIDELFWFWPAKAGDGAGVDLQFLDQGEVSVVTQFWRGQETLGDPHHTAVHNLAVLFQLQALDLENKAWSADLSTGERERCDHCWTEALRRWHALLDQEGFWSRMNDRIRELDDPRLTTSVTRRIRQRLPVALVLILARLAVRATEAGRHADAKRQVQRIRQAGFEGSDVAEALQLATQPLCNRLLTAGETAQEKAQAEPRRGAEVCRGFFDKSRSSLAVLDLVLPKNHAARVAARDEVALHALGCQVSYGNETEDWGTSIALLKTARELATSTSARDRIEKNLQIVQDNQEQKELMDKCYFCEERDPQDRLAHKVELHGEVQHIGVRIEVPRCLRCHRAHDRQDNIGGGFGCLGLLSGGGTFVALVESTEGCFALLAGVAVLGVSATLGAVFGRLPPGIKAVTESTGYPPIQALLGRGWKLVKKPPGTNS